MVNMRYFIYIFITQPVPQHSHDLLASTITITHAPTTSGTRPVQACISRRRPALSTRHHSPTTPDTHKKQVVA